MFKHQPYSRRRLRRLRKDWLRRNTKVLAISTLGLTGLLGVVSLLLVGPDTRTAFSWWLLGVVQATVVVVWLHMLDATFLAYEREAVTQLRGAWGEENTRSELKRAKRKRLIWGWVDSINLQCGDLDHLVVTRRGGLVAIDSKWRNQASDTVDMARAAHRARLRTEGLANSLLRNEKGVRHRAKVNPVAVTPVVVLWGAAQHGVPDGANVDGIDFVAGHSLLEWLSRLEHEPVDKAAATDVVARLEEFRASTRDRALRPVVGGVP
jgi:hypothetical protein